MPKPLGIIFPEWFLSISTSQNGDWLKACHISTFLNFSSPYVSTFLCVFEKICVKNNKKKLITEIMSS